MLMKLVDHIVLHSKNKKRKMVLLQCPICKKVFSKRKKDTHLQKNGKATFCSKECADKANILRKSNDIAFIENIKNNVIKEYVA